MSIFKSTFKEYIQDQILARQDLLNYQEDRPIQFQQYVTGKSPWVKMTSFVDYQGDKSLAEKYILKGGTLYPKPGSIARDEAGKYMALRSGIYSKNASYGNDLGDLNFGLRPMPGIESITVKSLGAYGSLRECTVKYYAWDLTQLENLNILFQKPGYPVLVEWGWSTYLNNNVDIVSSDILTIDCFDSRNTFETIQDKIKEFNKKYYGNYDGCIGFIKNYSYTMLQNGGFECTTTIMSIGEVIENIKMNSTPFKKDDPFSKIKFKTNNDSSKNIVNVDEEEILDEFESFMTQVSKDAFLESTDVNLENLKKKAYSDINLDTTILYFGDKTDIPLLPPKDIRNNTYIQFSYFIYLLNNISNLILDNKEKMIVLELPHPTPNNIGLGFCVASYNSMTIDNTVCTIINPRADIITDGKGNKIGFIPKGVTNVELRKKYLYSDSQNGETNLGIIGNIYVNIGKIISIYRILHQQNKGSVYLGPFLRSLLSEIEYSLGSINAFDLLSIDNRGIIIDKHYVELPSESGYDSKFSINILGTRNTVRQHNLNSKIFQDMSNMIAIAAQDRANVAAIQTSTNVYLNQNIINRLYKSVSNREDSSSSFDEDIVYNNTKKLVKYIVEYVLPGKSPNSSNITVSSLNTILNHLLVIGDRATDYKAIVPISLEIKIDGIGGITIGEIFTVNPEVLPKEYRRKDVGFIVTGISHEVNRPDWVTTITTQFCLLDQKQKQEESIALSKKFSAKFQSYVKEYTLNASKSINSYNLLIAILDDFFEDRLSILDYNDESKTRLALKKDSTDPLSAQIVAASFAKDGSSISVENIFGELGKLTILGEKQQKYRSNLSSLITTNSKLLSAYLEDRVNSNNVAVNYVRYLDFVITNLSIYKEMNADIKLIFNTVFFDLLYCYFWGTAPQQGKDQITNYIPSYKISSDIQISLDKYRGFIRNPYTIFYLNNKAVSNFGEILYDSLVLKTKISIDFKGIFD